MTWTSNVTVSSLALWYPFSGSNKSWKYKYIPIDNNFMISKQKKNNRYTCNSWTDTWLSLPVLIVMFSCVLYYQSNCAHVTFMFNFFFDLCRPVLENLHINCEHYHLLPWNPFSTFDVNEDVTCEQGFKLFIGTCTNAMRSYLDAPTTYRRKNERRKNICLLMMERYLRSRV